MMPVEYKGNFIINFFKRMKSLFVKNDIKKFENEKIDIKEIDGKDVHSIEYKNNEKKKYTMEELRDIEQKINSGEINIKDLSIDEMKELIKNYKEKIEEMRRDLMYKKAEMSRMLSRIKKFNEKRNV